MTTSPPERPGDEDPDRAVLEEAAEVLESVLPDEETEMAVLDVARRIVLVHAHPDDETTATGVTMARYAAQGAHVTLVTCTRGEEGEIVVPELASLGPAAEDRLGEHRVEELATAMEALRVTDFRFLGEAGRYRDSGMAGTPANDHPQAFLHADVDEAALALVAVLREVRPQVLVTYDERGGYGHPDHIQAHRVAMRAVELSADPDAGEGEPWQVDKVYWSVLPRDRFLEGMRQARESGMDMSDWGGEESDAEFQEYLTPDDLVTTQVDGRSQLDAKLAAWRAHASQISQQTFFFTLPPEVMSEWFGREFYRCVRGTPVPDPADPDGYETDLFAGIA